eukprot:scaffold39038_cov62-Phaeocystis_antarctica.AAC.2
MAPLQCAFGLRLAAARCTKSRSVSPSAWTRVAGPSFRYAGLLPAAACASSWPSASTSTYSVTRALPPAATRALPPAATRALPPAEPVLLLAPGCAAVGCAACAAPLLRPSTTASCSPNWSSRAAPIASSSIGAGAEAGADAGGAAAGPALVSATSPWRRWRPFICTPRAVTGDTEARLLRSRAPARMCARACACAWVIACARACVYACAFERACWCSPGAATCNGLLLQRRRRSIEHKHGIDVQEEQLAQPAEEAENGCVLQHLARIVTHCLDELDQPNGRVDSKPFPRERFQRHPAAARREEVPESRDTHAGADVRRGAAGAPRGYKKQPR